MKHRNSCAAESRLGSRLALSGASGIASLEFGLCLLVALWLGLLTSSAAEAGSRLSDEKSPYLLQHAGDVIDWHPWGRDALELAKRENKMIFLSIGYSTCHWCHVMTRTTFSDSRIVSVLNSNFVSILVDREERPDLDRHFADVMMAMIGRSGWPANFLMTPDLVPVFAGAYMGPESAYGEPGLLNVAQIIATEWRDRRDKVSRDAMRFAAELQDRLAPVGPGAARGLEDPRNAAILGWTGHFDLQYGGFGTGQKFPLPNVLSFLLHEAVKRRDANLLDMVLLTLDHMAAGGIRDQLGGAFHRYSVDRTWRVPHFEIMLDGNASLAVLYIEAFQASGNSRYALVARGILDDLLARFRMPGGGFASALDADTEGIEGLYYTWTLDEIRSVLGSELFTPFVSAYFDMEGGSVKGRGVLRPKTDPRTLLVMQSEFAESRQRLLEARSSRPAPLRDEKILTSGNALAVSAFAKAGQVLKDKHYVEIAQTEMKNLLGRSAVGLWLSHTRIGEWIGDEVFLDDYAFAIQALLDLYEADFDPSHLDVAAKLMEVTIDRFYSGSGRPFRFTPKDKPSDIPTRHHLEEQGLPSGNAAALAALLRLHLFSASAEQERLASSILDGMGRYLDRSAMWSTGLLRALDFRPTEAYEIVIVGRAGAEDTEDLLDVVRKELVHGVAVAVVEPDAPPENDEWPLLARRPMMDNLATAYVCRKRLCDLPVNTATALSSQLTKLVHQDSTATTLEAKRLNAFVLQ